MPLGGGGGGGGRVNTAPSDEQKSTGIGIVYILTTPHQIKDCSETNKNSFLFFFNSKR